MEKETLLKARFMSNIKIFKGDFSTKLELEHAGVRAGFPSPAEDYMHETLDFNRDYIRHPEATFYGDVEGDSMRDAGIYDGDRVIIDKAVEPHDGSIVIAWVGGEGFTMKYLDLKHRNDGYIELRPANPDYPVFKIDNPDEFQIWGTVIHLIRTFEKV
jgi:DNA polymerase V